MSRSRKTIKTPDSATGVGQPIETEKARWNFCGSIPETFASHVRKSIPYYEDGHDLIYYLCDFFLSQGQRADCMFFHDHGSMGSLN